jgi:hypothetical protein
VLLRRRELGDEQSVADSDLIFQGRAPEALHRKWSLTGPPGSLASRCLHRPQLNSAAQLLPSGPARP